MAPEIQKSDIVLSQSGRDQGRMMVVLDTDADYLLLARSDIASIVDSLCAPLSLINALIVTIAMKRKKDAEETFTKLEGLWDEYNVYEKVDEKSEHES